MKDGLRFYDCYIHIMEPPDLFERYLDPTFKERVVLPIGADGRPVRGTIVVDGLPTTMDAELQQYRKKSRPPPTRPTARSRCRARGSPAASTSPFSASTTPRRSSSAWRWRAWTSPSSIRRPA